MRVFVSTLLTIVGFGLGATVGFQMSDAGTEYKRGQAAGFRDGLQSGISVGRRWQENYDAVRLKKSCETYRYFDINNQRYSCKLGASPDSL